MIAQTHFGLNPFWDNPGLGLVKLASNHSGDAALTSTYSDSYQLMLDLLIHARKEAQLTQAQLAVRLRKPQSFVSKYERGERRLDVIELLQVCHELGVDAHQLIRKLERLPLGLGR